MIGLFDSGFGGLTILHALIDTLPQYSYLYLGDNARAPYGSRSAEEIFEFTRQGVAYLFKQGSELIVLACNTASANALRRIQQEVLPSRYPDKRVLGILVPTIEQITGVSWQQTTHTVSAPLGTSTVGVLATEATVTSGAYPAEIHKRNPSLKVVQQACPGLVEAIEAGGSLEKIDTLLEQYISALEAQAESGPALSAVLLGCTHYALVANRIHNFLPPNVKLYEQPEIAATSLKKYLASHPEMVSRLDHQGTRRFITTANSEIVSQQSAKYFGQPIAFSKITLTES